MIYNHVQLETGKNPDQIPRSTLTIQIDGDQSCSIDRHYGIASGERRLDAEIVLVNGQRFSFGARRSVTQGSGFAITDFADSTNRSKREAILLKFRMGVAKFVFSPFQAENRNLSDLLRPETFRIVDCKTLHEKSEEIVQVRFVNSASNPTKLSGKVDLLPARGWAMRRHELVATLSIKRPASSTNGEYYHKIVTEVDYDADRSAIAVPKSVVVTKEKRITKAMITRVKFNAAVDPQVFTLSDYGLPDVSSPPKDPARSRVIPWLLRFAGVTFGFALFIFFPRGTRRYALHDVLPAKHAE